MTKKISLKLTVLLAAVAFSLSGCTVPFIGKIGQPKPGDGQKPPVVEPVVPPEIKEQLDAQSQIKKFSDYEELAAFLEENQTSGNSGYYGYGAPMMARSMEDSMGSVASDIGLGASESFAVPAATAGLGEKKASNDFSRTNVQVEGVDEGDIIKTDGKYVYALVKNSLFIIEGYPAKDAKILSKIEFHSQPQEIYINGSRLAVFGNNSNISSYEPYKTFRRRSEYAFFKVFDLSDPANPKKVRDLDFEGSYSNSRMIGDYVYLVTNNYNYYYILEEPVVPRLLENGEVLASKCASGVRCFAPDVYYFDLPYDSYNFTLVSAINLKDEKEDVSGDVYIMSSGQNMFVSEKNIYLTYGKNVSEYQLVIMVLREIVFPKLSSREQDKIKEIEATKNYVLNEEEKMAKIMTIVERYAYSLSDEDQEALEKAAEEKMKEKYKDISKEMEKTVIHKIAINGRNLEYKTFGEVTGSVLNQFSMDESNGYFRIATTKNRTWSQYAEEEDNKSYNNLYVLDGDMKTVGRLEDLARDERIYSVRFMQNRAYMVTFKQMDPLFVIDLSNPTDPRVLGELKIPGFSDYLHPYDDKLLIGIGKDTGATEWGGVQQKGLKLSLFDVSDVANPKEVNSYVFKDQYSDSIARTEHKAFLFSKEKNLLAIPVTMRMEQEEVIVNDQTGIRRPDWGGYFSGAAVFKIDEKGFELRGTIDHSDGGQKADQYCYWGGCYYDNNVVRSLYIDDILYTFSNRYLVMSRLDDLGVANQLKMEFAGGLRDEGDTSSERDEKRIFNIRSLQGALELYYNDKNEYPAAVNFGGSLQDGNVTYMTVVPNNPLPRDDGKCPDADYAYERQNKNTYSVSYCLGVDLGGIKAGAHHATPSGIVDD